MVVNKPSRIAVACGGTGGHIFPGLATAQRLRDRGHEVTLWLAGKDIERMALDDWKGEVVTVPAQGFSRHGGFHHFQTAWKLLTVARQCRILMGRHPADVLLAMGSYASVGPVRAALAHHVPIVLHEANVIPGRAIALASRWATRVAVSFEETCYYLRRKGVEVTGMPLRAQLEQAARQEWPPRAENAPLTVLVMGGSRGAHRLNEICADAFEEWQSREKGFRVIHLTGLDDEELMRKRYASCGITADVYAFHHDIAKLYRKADLVICRAGASTCAELTAFRLPALLVPYPYAVRDHQTANARALEKWGTARVIAESDLQPDWLVRFLSGFFRDPALGERMRRAALRSHLHEGAERLVELIEDVIALAQEDAHARY